MSDLEDFFEQLDLDAADKLYQRVSVDPERFKRTLRTAGRPWADGAQRPSLDEVRHTARWVVEQSAFRSGALGGFAGLTGAASVPAEVGLRGVSTLRLAQRLAIVYGFDPARDRGRTALWRALAAGLDVDLPEHGPVGMRATSVPRALTQGGRDVGATLTRALFQRTAQSVLKRLIRLVPIASVPTSVSSARQRTEAVGDRMIAVLDRLYEPPLAGEVEEATIVGG